MSGETAFIAAPIVMTVWIVLAMGVVKFFKAAARGQQPTQSRVTPEDVEQQARSNRAFGRAVLDFKPVDHEPEVR